MNLESIRITGFEYELRTSAFKAVIPVKILPVMVEHKKYFLASIGIPDQAAIQADNLGLVVVLTAQEKNYKQCLQLKGAI